MTPVLDFANAALWEQLWQTDISAVVDSIGRYEPIAPIEVPILPSSHILAAYITNSAAPNYWRFAGFCTQKLPVAITVGGTPNTDASPERRKIWLNRWTILDFPRYTTAYSVLFEPPHWFQNFNVILYQWTGTDERGLTFLRDGSELGDRLDELAGDIGTVQSDLDAYFGL